MRALYALIILWTLFPLCAQSQPWKSPLRCAWSVDGRVFSPPVVFQDSAGVASVTRWKGDTLIAVFQWFRLPNPSPTWDRVATKFSYDNGRTWSDPRPIILADFPATYQRPFDPTIVVLSADSLRLYFSSSNGMPMGSDSIIDTHSAVSTDGITYVYEQGARVDVADRKIIDPAVVRFGPGWHLTAPIGAPQEGAYHYVSPDGLKFSRVPSISSDAAHNWTGNFAVVKSNELRFYGCGREIWFATSSNGGVWSSYTATNLKGGDPSVVRVADSLYFIVFTGEPYTTHVDSPAVSNVRVRVNGPSMRCIVTHSGELDNCDVDIYDLNGRCLATGTMRHRTQEICLSAWTSGSLFLRFSCSGNSFTIPVVTQE